MTPLGPDDIPDDTALAQREAHLERQLMAQGLTDSFRDALRDGISLSTAEGTRGSLQAMRARIANTERVRAVPRLVPRTSLWTAGFSLVAGAAVLSLAIGGYFVVHGRPKAVGTDAVAVPSMTEVQTVRGQRAILQLSDGSTVTLGVASRIRYPRDFGTTTRDLELEGEAYFDVRHDGRLPFRVRTAHGVSEDIGTRFTVRAYTGERATRVIVEEGLVGIGHGVTLAAGDLARLTPDAPPLVQHGVPVQTLIGWTRGELNFVNTPFRDVAADLRRWYDVDVQVGDPTLADVLVTSSFGKAPIGDVLTALAHGMGARVERRASAWLLIPNTRSSSHGPADTGHTSRPGVTDAR